MCATRNAHFNPSDKTTPRDAVHSSKKDPTAAKEEFYYSFSPHPSYRFVSLDTYDANAIRCEPTTAANGAEAHELFATAVTVLSAQNPNEDKNDCGGMHGLGRRCACRALGAVTLFSYHSVMQAHMHF